MSGPEEREIKLSAGDGFVLPDLHDLAGQVADSGIESLETVYWDTAELDVARRDFGLRHRRRCDHPEDPGVWTLKTPGHDDGDRLVRGEHELPSPGAAPPPALLALLPAEVDSSALHPVAVLRADRRVLTVTGSDGAEVEVMDDTVSILAADGSVAERFRELEVEVMEGGDPLADRVAARLREAGAGPPETSSKYRRALRVLGHPFAGIAAP